MADSDESVETLIRRAQVGDTVRIRIEKRLVSAEVRDRISPVMEAATGHDGGPTFGGITKDSAGLWDFEQMTGAKDATIVEVVIRRAASDL